MFYNIKHETNPECTLDNFIYRSALLHAFLTSIDKCDVMSYEIIHNELHSNYFYSTFLDSIEYISYLLREEVIRWTYQEFSDVILHNDIVPPLLFNSWMKYIHLLEHDKTDDEDQQFCNFIDDMKDLTVSTEEKSI